MSEYLDEVPQLKRESESCGICRYTVRDPIPGSLAELIVSRLPADRELSFHDPFYPSPSDPGAFVSIRQQDGCCIYCFGNHGWHQDWQRQSKEFLAHYLALCLRKHSSTGGHGWLSLTPVLPASFPKRLKYRTP
ncbi:MAG TPA: hypothetical protein VI136_25015 [Verrucomicrobiae bacterium]